MNKKVLGLVVGLAVLVAAWFFLSPLFIDRTIDEAPPTATATVIPTREAVDALSSGEQAALMDQVMAAMADRPDKTMNQRMPSDPEPRVIRQGNFVNADSVHRGQGDALIYRLHDGSHLLRLENFRVTNGPALVVYLAGHPEPQRAADVKQAFHSLGKLKGNVGGQNYPIPRGVDIAGYNSVVIWCELFDVVFSPAALTGDG